MLMNLSEVFTSQGCVLTQQYSMEGKSVEVFGKEHRVVKGVPIQITVSGVSDGNELSNGKAHVDGRGCVTFELCCDRCLKPIQYDMELSFELDVYAPDVIPENADADEQIYMEGYQLNIKTLVDSEIIMHWPTKVLCRPDCKGICMKCGKDLNTGECGCDTFVPDPRMAAIKDIFNANKEV